MATEKQRVTAIANLTRGNRKAMATTRKKARAGEPTSTERGEWPPEKTARKKSTRKKTSTRKTATKKTAAKKTAPTRKKSAKKTSTRKKSTAK